VPTAKICGRSLSAKIPVDMNNTICYGRTDQFDLEVKVQRSPTMVRDTSSGGGLPTC